MLGACENRDGPRFPVDGRVPLTAISVGGQETVLHYYPAYALGPVSLDDRSRAAPSKGKSTAASKIRTFRKDAIEVDAARIEKAPNLRACVVVMAVIFHGGCVQTNGFREFKINRGKPSESTCTGTGHVVVVRRSRENSYSRT